MLGVLDFEMGTFFHTNVLNKDGAVKKTECARERIVIWASGINFLQSRYFGEEKHTRPIWQQHDTRLKYWWTARP